MLIKTSSSGFTHPVSSDITPQGIYQQRRDLMKLMAGGKSAVAGAVTMEKITDYKDVTTYNNFYEFGTDKADPGKNAHTLATRPWTVAVEGLVKQPKTYAIEDLIKLSAQEERIYRLRCVEGWSMVIPWVGYSLAELIKKVEPLGNAKYVEFITQADPKTMPFVGSRVLDWPYVEALRMDEAMNPLTLLTFGMYGEVLPNQSGAPVRLVVPWKYGFKSGKSIVKIRFTDKEPRTAWNKAAANKYMAFTPTSTRPLTTRAGARPQNGGSAKTACSPKSVGPSCSTAMKRRLDRCTRAWI